MKKLKIKNLWIAKVENNQIVPFFGDVVIERGLIKNYKIKNFKDYNFKKTKCGENEYDAQGRVATVPLINFHDHFYSRLAKGLTITDPMTEFHKILLELWWKLDRILDRDMIRASAQMALLESIDNGVLYIFDHHSSPKHSRGSLSIIKEEVENFDLNAVLAYETTDRNEKELNQQGFNENVDFVNHCNDKIKSLFGLHASFTLYSETLEKVSKFINEKRLGIHIHLSESSRDNLVSQYFYNLSPINRLYYYNLLNDKSILAHCVYLKEKDFEIIKKTGAAIALNLDSNMNNNVGLIDFKYLNKDIPVLIGTDGMHANIAKSMKNLFLIYRYHGFSFNESFNYFINTYFNQLNFIKKFFPDFSFLRLKEKANFIIWDYIPPTPMNSDNFFGHFIYGILERNIYGVINQGKVLKYNNTLKIKGIEKIYKNIITQGERVYNFFKK